MGVGCGVPGRVGVSMGSVSGLEVGVDVGIGVSVPVGVGGGAEIVSVAGGAVGSPACPPHPANKRTLKLVRADRTRRSLMP